MTVAALVTEGIGPGSSILFVLTGGLGVGEATVTTTGGPRPLRKRKYRAPDWQRQDEERRRLEDEVREIYARVVEGKTSVSVTREIVETLAPFVDESLPASVTPVLPRAAYVDFSAVAADAEALGRLLQAFTRTQAAVAARELAERQRALAAIEADDMQVITHLVEAGLI